MESVSNAVNVLSGTTSAIQLGVTSTTTNTGASVGQINISSGAAVAVTIPAAGRDPRRGVLFTPAVSVATSAGGGAFAGKLDLGSNDLVVTGSTLAQVTAACWRRLRQRRLERSAESPAARPPPNSTHLTALGVIVNDSGSVSTAVRVGWNDLTPPSTVRARQMAASW
jgi:hypothetical protein